MTRASRSAASAGAAGDAGSVFIEALVASAILAGILVGAFRVEAESASRRHAVEARRYALMVARSALAQVGSATPLVAGTVEGSDGGDAWRIEMQPCAAERGRSAAGVLYCVTASVRDAAGGAPLAVLNTRRLAPAA